MVAGETSERVCKAFCVGQAKSGTASLYSLLAENYRAAHEPERQQLLEMIVREGSGDVSPSDVRAFLLERQRRLNLEFDIAWANQFIIEHLVDAFPQAGFIVLIRDCYAWLRSVLGHLITRDIPRDVRNFLPWWFTPERYPNSLHERRLRELGLYSVRAYLNAWNGHIERCLDLIPEDRRLILKTHELDRSHKLLAEFLNIPIESLDTTKGRLNQSPTLLSLDYLVQPAYLDEVVRAVCGKNMRRFFPEITRFVDAYQD
jgi:hypothetical protein